MVSLGLRRAMGESREGQRSAPRCRRQMECGMAATTVRDAAGEPKSRARFNAKRPLKDDFEEKFREESDVGGYSKRAERTYAGSIAAPVNDRPRPQKPSPLRRDGTVAALLFSCSRRSYDYLPVSSGYCRVT